MDDAREVSSDDLAEDPLRPVSDRRALGDLKPHHDGYARLRKAVPRKPNGEIRCEHGPPSSGDPFDIALPGEPVGTREHTAYAITIARLVRGDSRPRKQVAWMYGDADSIASAYLHHLRNASA